MDPCIEMMETANPSMSMVDFKINPSKMLEKVAYINYGKALFLN